MAICLLPVDIGLVCDLAVTHVLAEAHRSGSMRTDSGQFNAKSYGEWLGLQPNAIQAPICEL